MRVILHRSLNAVLFGAAAMSGACARPYGRDEYPFTTVDPSTDFGNAIQDIYASVTYIVLAVSVVVAALFFYTLFRFRDDGSPGNPEQIHGNTQLEVGWTLLPVVLVVIMVVPTIRTIFEIADAAPQNALEVRVTGKRWWWAFEYIESGVQTANELHIPAGRPVSLLIESDSVIHSFWTPRLGGKRDAVPGRVNRMWFTVQDEVAAGSPIEYRGECAEYCGEAHALMRYSVFAHAEAEFEGWLAAMQAPVELASAAADVQGGEALFKGRAGCAGCHAITGSGANGLQGPNLTRFGDRKWLAAGTLPNTTENLHKWISDPNAVKPGTTMVANASRKVDGMNIPVELTDEEVSQLVAYLSAQKSN